MTCEVLKLATSDIVKTGIRGKGEQRRGFVIVPVLHRLGIEFPAKSSFG